MDDQSLSNDTRIPDNIRESYAYICGEVSRAFGKLNIENDLFSSDESISILEIIGLDLFKLIRESLIQDIFMTIGRLNDPPKTFNVHENISMETLVQHCGGIPDLLDHHKKFKTSCEVIEPFRNKRLAHNDLHSILDTGSDLIPGISRKQTREILEYASETLNTIHRYYTKMDFYLPPILNCEGKDFIAYLKQSIENDKELIKLNYGISPNH